MSYPIAPATAFQLRLICEEETAVAVRPVGVDGGVHTAGVVALIQVVCGEEQVEFFCADILYAYVVNAALPVWL